MQRQNRIPFLGFFILQWLAFPLIAAEPLPSPLTLDYVMSMPLSSVPTLRMAEEELNQSKALKRQIAATDDSSMSISLTSTYLDPSPVAPDNSNTDYEAVLRLQAPIYDFGRSGNAEDAASQRLMGQELRYRVSQNQFRLELLRRFSAVVLADLAFIRDNEAMATAYVRLDRLKAKRDLEQASDVDVAAQEQLYQVARVNYFTSQAQQQITRSQLGQVLDRPDELVAEIAAPKPLPEKLDIPESEDLRQRVLADNPGLQALRHDVTAAEQEVAAARAERRPMLDAEAKAGDYKRDMGNRNDWEVGLRLQVPLWQGDRVSAKIASATARLQQLKASLREMELRLIHQSRALVNELKLLQILRQQKLQLVDYRDIYLDLSRARYEMEVTSDLGDSMVHVSAARYELADVNLKLIQAFARMNALLGKPAYPLQESKHE